MGRSRSVCRIIISSAPGNRSRCSPSLAILSDSRLKIPICKIVVLEIPSAAQTRDDCLLLIYRMVNRRFVLEGCSLLRLDPQQWQVGFGVAALLLLAALALS